MILLKKLLAFLILTGFFFFGGSLLTDQGNRYWAGSGIPFNLKIIFLLAISLVFSFAVLYAPRIFRDIHLRKKK